MFNQKKEKGIMSNLEIGDKIKCENGHTICEIIKPIRVYDTLHADNFKFTDQQYVDGDCLQQCHCGGVWITAGNGIQFPYIIRNSQKKEIEIDPPEKEHKG